MTHLSEPKNSTKLLFRSLTVGGLVLVLLIPLLLIRGLIHDRERYRGEAVDRVSQSMAGPQRLVGPLRIVPWKETRRVNANGQDGRVEAREETVEGYLVQPPETLEAGGEVTPDVRRIGLYDVRVFQWQALIQAEFGPLRAPVVAGREYGEPHLVFGLGDVRGLVGTPSLRADGVPLALEPGAGALVQRMDGVHATLPRDPSPSAEGEINLPVSKIRLEMTLAGTQSLGIVPVADSNDIELRSSWPHPLFGGRFLPTERRVDANGFSASWRISSLASAAQAQLRDATVRWAPRLTYGAVDYVGGEQMIDSVQLDLVDPVDVYTQADRASKYGILFVVLTFVGFALFELITRLRIHPLQYLLVGLALAIFFLLLLSLSERIAFWRAYAISAAACIGLQFVYLSGVLKSWWRAGLFASLLTALYGALYSLLVSEDNALLMGSLLLFGVLAGIQWITRKVDWYERSAA